MDEPTLVISGRATAEEIELAVRFLAKMGHKPTTKSEVVRLVIKAVADLGEFQYGFEAAKTNHEALENLSKYGIQWPLSTHRRDVSKVLAYDTFGEMDYDEFLEQHSQVIQLKNMQKQSEDGAPDVAEDEDLARELEELDRELKRADDM